MVINVFKACTLEHIKYRTINMYVHTNVVIVLVERGFTESSHGVSSTEDLILDDIANNVS